MHQLSPMQSLLARLNFAASQRGTSGDEALEKTAVRALTSMQQEIDTLKDELKKLTAVHEAAKKIAWHKANCAILVGFNNPCKCGLHALREAQAEVEKA